MARPKQRGSKMMDPNRDDALEQQPTDRPAEEPVEDNDQESHVSPPDNDGETVPQDEVAR